MGYCWVCDVFGEFLYVGEQVLAVLGVGVQEVFVELEKGFCDVGVDGFLAVFHYLDEEQVHV